jgi:hypothetical protein
MKKGEKKIWKWTVEVHKMEWLYPYVRLEDFMKVCKWLEEENQKLKSEWVVIGWEDHKNYIDMEIYLRDTEELRKQLDIRENAYNDLLWAYKKLEEKLWHTIWYDEEEDLYEDVEWDLC